MSKFYNKWQHFKTKARKDLADLSDHVSVNRIFERDDLGSIDVVVENLAATYPTQPFTIFRAQPPGGELVDFILLETAITYLYQEQEESMES